MRLSMLFFYEGNSEKSGIYEIRNRYSGRSYIGQAKRLKERWIGGHKNHLLVNKSKNKFLQADFNKCKEVLGHDDFLEFHILEALPDSTKEERNVREEYWIKTYKENEYELYNFKEKISGAIGKWSNTPEETKQIISKNSKNLWNNEEYRNKLISILNSDEIKEKMSLRSKKLWDNPEYRKKISKPRSDETKKFMSASKKKYLENNPEAIQRLSKQATKNWNNEEYRKNRSDATRELWKDPDYRARACRNRSENAKKYWAQKRNNKCT